MPDPTLTPADLELIVSALGPVIQTVQDRIVEFDSQQRVDLAAELRFEIQQVAEYVDTLAQTIVQMQTQATDGLFGAGMQNAYRRFITLEAARMKVRPGEVLAMRKAMAEGEDDGADLGFAG